MPFESRNPYTGALLERYDYITAQEIDTRLEKATAAFPLWRNFTFAQRAACFLRLAEELTLHKQEFAHLVSLEMGKMAREAAIELDKCILTCKYYAAEAEQMLQSQTLEVKGKTAHIHLQPLGAIFGIFPWNFPFWQVLRFAIPSLMAGNVAIAKHAENVPQCALALQRSFDNAGFPKGVFSTVFCSLEQLEQIVAHPVVKGVTLTGSDRAGSSFAALAGKYLKKTVLELGGSDPFIVLEDADLQLAAATGATSRFQNTGQSCVAAKRFILHQKIADEFTSLFLAQMEKLVPGDPALDTTGIGVLARPDLCSKLEKQVNDTVQAGARILAGGKRISDTFYAPTVLTDIPPGSPAFSEELFGPVASFFIARDDQHALELANATNYGLGASIWTKDSEKAKRLALETEAGMVFTNSMVKSTPELPFGGIKNSGMGRELSAYGIREFVNVKLVY